MPNKIMPASSRLSGRPARRGPRTCAAVRAALASATSTARSSARTTSSSGHVRPCWPSRAVRASITSTTASVRAGPTLVAGAGPAAIAGRLRRTRHTQAPSASRPSGSSHSCRLSQCPPNQAGTSPATGSPAGSRQKASTQRPSSSSPVCSSSHEPTGQRRLRVASSTPPTAAHSSRASTCVGATGRLWAAVAGSRPACTCTAHGKVPAAYVSPQAPAVGSPKQQPVSRQPTHCTIRAAHRGRARASSTAQPRPSQRRRATTASVAASPPPNIERAVSVGALLNSRPLHSPTGWTMSLVPRMSARLLAATSVSQGRSGKPRRQPSQSSSPTLVSVASR